MEFNEVKEKMEKSINNLKENFLTIRAGRANPAILNKVVIPYYGVPTPVSQVASVSVPEARTILIQPWDSSILKEIEKGIQKADLGINPQNDGKAIRLNFPEPTEERRKELVKDVKKFSEECKIAVRAVRRDAIEEYKSKQKKSEITEDDLKRAEDEIQKLTDKSVEQIDKLLADKESEIMSV